MPHNKILTLFNSLSEPYRLAFIMFCIQKDKRHFTGLEGYVGWVADWLNNKNGARSARVCEKNTK